jgi:hypothetical protein
MLQVGNFGQILILEGSLMPLPDYKIIGLPDPECVNASGYSLTVYWHTQYLIFVVREKLAK